MSRWLEATLGLGLWLEELQRQGVDAATHWNETLAAGAREAEESQRIESLLQVPAHMAYRQIGVAAHTCQAQWQHLIDRELDGLRDLNAQALEQWQALARGWPAGVPVAGTA